MSRRRRRSWGTTARRGMRARCRPRARCRGTSWPSARSGRRCCSGTRATSGRRSGWRATRRTRERARLPAGSGDVCAAAARRRRFDARACWRRGPRVWTDAGMRPRWHAPSPAATGREKVSSGGRVREGRSTVRGPWRAIGTARSGQRSQRGRGAPAAWRVSTRAVCMLGGATSACSSVWWLRLPACMKGSADGARKQMGGSGVRSRACARAGVW
mmetsp:Transcript_66274/g.176459  ORF Transcript_66274/g.176459 Transcript_66274/m.176459 type:complete len:215 (-) Transcript_66274:234-878(-)